MQKDNIPVITNGVGLQGKCVLVRASLNVPIENGSVRNAFRIEQSLETIQYLLEKKAKVILVSHLGKDGSQSLRPVFEALKEYVPITFSPEVIGSATSSLRSSLKDGEVLLLENVRKDAREMKNDPGFARELSLLADIFVNDDFAASHRAHASLHAICTFLPSYAGLHFMREYTELQKAIEPQQPSLFILGGAKFETKMPLIEKSLSLYTHVFIGGALANDLLKAKGFEVGASLVSSMSLQGSPLLAHPKILLPIDVTVAKGDTIRITTVEDVQTDESILDVGPKTIELLNVYIQKAEMILWNGPLGNYEKGFQEQTIACAKLIAQADAFSVVGGGDTVASIESLDAEEDFGFLSTAGGAMLTFLECGSLVALEALVAAEGKQETGGFLDWIRRFFAPTPRRL